jgi:hypothetical protein
LGVLLATWGTSALIVLAPDNVPRLNEVRADGWVLGFTLLISLASSAFFGLAPALQACPSSKLYHPGIRVLGFE